MFDDFIAKLKNSWKSFTNWFNGTGIVVLQILVTEPGLIDFLTVHDLALILLVGNIVLRFKTSTSLADK